MEISIVWLSELGKLILCYAIMIIEISRSLTAVPFSLQLPLTLKLYRQVNSTAGANPDGFLSGPNV